jgi:hypothetical protein
MDLPSVICPQSFLSLLYAWFVTIPILLWAIMVLLWLHWECYPIYPFAWLLTVMDLSVTMLVALLKWLNFLKKSDKERMF